MVLLGQKDTAQGTYQDEDQIWDLEWSSLERMFVRTHDSSQLFQIFMPIFTRKNLLVAAWWQGGLKEVLLIYKF